MRVLYIDCSAGISGDMSIGAFLDLGVNPDYLMSELKKLPVEGYRIVITKRTVRGITGTDFNVILDKSITSYWQEVSASSHHTHETHAMGTHGHRCRQNGDHEESLLNQPGQSRHHHAHTSWHRIKHLIWESKLNDQVKALAARIFNRLAQAESRVHRVDIEDVHFHEVGAVDSIVDIVGLAICMDYLKPGWVVVSPMNTGSGTIQCRHGILSVPAPATSEILAERKAIAYSSGIMGELVTPTGAAIACEIGNEFSSMPLMQVEKVGYGTGKKDFGIPAVVKIVMGTLNQKVKDSLMTMENSMDKIKAPFEGLWMEP